MYRDHPSRFSWIPLFITATLVFVACGDTTDPSSDEGPTPTLEDINNDGDTATPGSEDTPEESPTQDEADTPVDTPAQTPEGTPEDTPEPSPVPDNYEVPADCDTLVEGSEDDQTVLQNAFSEATPGEILCLAPGDYILEGELTLGIDGLTVKGINRPRLDFSGQTSGDSGLLITGDQTTIQGIRVVNTPGDGIKATEAGSLTLMDLEVIWENGPEATNGPNGLNLLMCDAIVIDGCSVSGASNAGILLDQSNNALVMNNEVAENVAGLASRNATNIELVYNDVHNNTAGILIMDVPNQPRANGERTKAHRNIVEGNNTLNFAPKSTWIAVIPSGTGILVLASDQHEVHDNTISDNTSFGLAMFAYEESLFGAWEDPQFNPYPEGNYLHNNTFDNNGTIPKGFAAALFGTGPIPPLVWDGCLDPSNDNDEALKNCYNDNLEGDDPATYVNTHLCSGEDNTYDLVEVTCVGTSLPTRLGGTVSGL